MSVRKVEVAEIPEKLKSMKLQEPMQVLIGNSIYEMVPLSHEEFSVFEKLLFTALGSITKAANARSEAGDSEVGVSQTLDLLKDAGVFELVKSFVVKEFEPDDVKLCTMSQLVFACSVWLELNLFSIPEEAWGRFLRVMSS
jgi:hypothetical protein